jgi:hypothetical protein
MLYKFLSIPVGTEELDLEASKVTSRLAKQGFVISKASYLQLGSRVIAQIIFQRVPIEHLPNQDGDPKNLKRIRLGDNVFYWDPCGDDDPGEDPTT